MGAGWGQAVTAPAARLTGANFVPNRGGVAAALQGAAVAIDTRTAPGIVAAIPGRLCAVGDGQTREVQLGGQFAVDMSGVIQRLGNQVARGAGHGASDLAPKHVGGMGADGQGVAVLFAADAVCWPGVGGLTVTVVAGALGLHASIDVVAAGDVNCVVAIDGLAVTQKAI